MPSPVEITQDTVKPSAKIISKQKICKPVNSSTNSVLS